MGEVLSFAIMLVLAFAPAAAAIAVGCLIQNRRLALALLAGGNLGAVAAWRFRALRNRAADRFAPEEPLRRAAVLAPPVTVPTLAPAANDLLDFHDFDRVKNRFDHWAIADR